MKRSIVFLVFLIIGLSVVSSTSVTLQAAIPASERIAFFALYNAVNGDSWFYIVAIIFVAISTFLSYNKTIRFWLKYNESKRPGMC